MLDFHFLMASSKHIMGNWNVMMRDKKEPRSRSVFLWKVILLKHLGVEIILNVQDIFHAQLWLKLRLNMFCVVGLKNDTPPATPRTPPPPAHRIVIWHSGHVFCAKVLQSCMTLCDPVDHSPLGSSVHGILQSRILELVAVPSSRASCQLRDQTHVFYVSCIGRQVPYL